MPMTIIFLGCLFFFLLQRVELKLEKKDVKASSHGRFAPMLTCVLLILLAVLMIAEWYLYANGEIYHEGIGFAGFLKLGALVVAGSISCWLQVKNSKGAARSPALKGLPLYGLALTIVLIIFIH